MLTSLKKVPSAEGLKRPDAGDFGLELQDRVHILATGVEQLWEAAKAGRFEKMGACGPIAELVADGPVGLSFEPATGRMRVTFLIDNNFTAPVEKIDLARFERELKRALGKNHFVDGESIYLRRSDAPGDFDRIAELPTRAGGGEAGGVPSQILEQLKKRLGASGIMIAAPESGEGESSTNGRLRFMPTDLKVASLEEFSSALKTACKIFLTYLDATSHSMDVALPLERVLIEAPKANAGKNGASEGGLAIAAMGGPTPIHMGMSEDNGAPMTMSDLPFLGLKDKLRHAGLVKEPEPVEFAHVRGQRLAVETMQDYALQLRFKEEFERRGSLVPRGIMMVGPAGNGKTTLARAVAYSTGAPFIMVNPEEIIDPLMGATERRIITFFQLADEEARKSKFGHAMLFFDEMDGSVGDRDGFSNSHSRGLIGALNNAMEGFRRFDNVTVIAASNRPLSIDNATRSRFPLVITIANPDERGRAEILETRFRLREARIGNKLCGEIDWGMAAARTDGFSGRDLEDLANAVCTEVARRSIVPGADNRSKPIELIGTGDILDTLAHFSKLSDGARRSVIGFCVVPQARPAGAKRLLEPTTPERISDAPPQQH